MVYRFYSKNDMQKLGIRRDSPISKDLARTKVYLYVGHPISSDNGLISQKLLLKSEFYYPLHADIGVVYSCL